MKKIYTILCFLAFAGIAGAQTEPLLTQYHLAPMQLNPSYAGVFQGKVRAIANYKRQWENIGEPFQTISASVDFQAFKTKTDVFGIGIDFMSDQAGTSNYSSLGANVSLAYARALDAYGHHFASFGFQAGYGQKSVQLSALRWGNQWTDTGFDPTGNTGESFVDEAVQYVDLSGGVAYHFYDEGPAKFRLGFAAYHLNKPKLSFLGTEYRLDPKYVLHAQFSYYLKNKGLAFNPSVIYMWQGKGYVLRYGLDVEFVFNSGSRFTGFTKRTSLAIGVYHTWLEMISPMLVLRKAGFSLFLSYDFTFGNVTRINNGLGGPEFGLQYRFGHNDGRTRNEITNAFF